MGLIDGSVPSRPRLGLMTKAGTEVMTLRWEGWEGWEGERVGAKGVRGLVSFD